MKQIIQQIRGYATYADRKKAVHQLARRGYNYFVPYKDTNAEFALQYGVANWVPAGQVHVDGGWYGSKRPACSRPWVNRP